MTQDTESNPFRFIPSVDVLLRTEEAAGLSKALGLNRVTSIARKVTDQLRQEIQETPLQDNADKTYTIRQKLLDRAKRLMKAEGERETLGGIRRVINATGVILHTNLGRAPLSHAARNAVISEAAGYCTLEYDATEGSRGKRGEHVERLLSQLTGAEDALVVNNCAAAALLILKVLAAGGETVVSRGELVEIGGDFRVPEVMANSGTSMVEVGSTNRTRLDDYGKAITDKTRLLMRVHRSNFRIVGFTTSPSLVELASLAHEFGLLLYEDAGSGALFDLSEYGLQDEPIIRHCLEQGADVVSFSGDKLVGSAQAGLIVGRREVIHRLRKHSLYRALRADKLCLAALEATLESHLRQASFAEIPVLAMLAITSAEIEERARNLVSEIESDDPQSSLRAEVISGESAIGGGCGPDVHPATMLIALEHSDFSADSLAEFLRSSKPPIISRVANEKVLLDLRTVMPDEDAEVLSSLRLLAAK
jgi:L-seryl-tRNA(Ser) seleniumtransferase